MCEAFVWFDGDDVFDPCLDKCPCAVGAREVSDVSGCACCFGGSVEECVGFGVLDHEVFCWSIVQSICVVVYAFWKTVVSCCDDASFVVYDYTPYFC